MVAIATLRNAAPSLIALVLAQADYIAALEEMAKIPTEAQTAWMLEAAQSTRCALDAALSRFVDEAGR